MNPKLPKEVKNILDKFKKKKFQIYIVGGAVRDLLMGKTVKDWDFTTDAKPKEILKVIPEGFYDNKFGTVGIPLAHPRGEAHEVTTGSHPGGEILEITTMRKEGLYKDHRHPSKLGWTNKIAEDLARRDFTINAIALSERSPSGLSLRVEDESKDKLVDPYQGQEDIKNHLIRAVGDPTKRFQEDALRLMRAIRIATQLQFEIEEKTFAAIQKNKELINEIAWERIRDELFKILESENPYLGIVKLRDSGLLQIILPELESCFGIIQQGPRHRRTYDIGEHSLLTLKFTPSKDPTTKLAALLHDIGKVKTVSTQPNGNVTFYGHDIVGAAIAKTIAKRFNLSRKQTDKLYSLIRWHMFTVDERQTDSAIRRFLKNVGLENVEDMMALRVGDRLGGGTQTETSWRTEKFKERIKEVLKKPFSISDLKINGNDVMKELNLKPGPKVGEILEKLFEEVLEDASKNTREYLLRELNNSRF